jgi:hypothetical protein
LVRISRKKGKLGQNGIHAIFTGGSRRGGRIPHRFPLYELENEIDPNRSSDRGTSEQNPSKPARDSPIHISRIFLAMVLVVISFATVVGFSGINSGLQHHTDRGTSGTGTSPPVKTSVIRIIAPSFSDVADISETVVSSNQSYTGTIETDMGDFIIAQIAYSQGSGGNLPDIYQVSDSQSNVYSRVASASPGPGLNFWEQVWTSRSQSTVSSTNITVSPNWPSCQRPCVTSIIITMTIGRYRGVAEVGASTTLAPDNSSTSQSINITSTQENSTLVELLSHGAYRNCTVDSPQPGTGQTSRNCFTATTERTEFFDHSVTNPQTYAESFTWAQAEIQRGIYLELKGNTVS